MKFGFLVFLLLPLLGNVYVLWHVYRLLPFSAFWKWSVIVIFIIAFLMMFVFFRFHHEMPMGLATMVYEVGTSWLIILLYLFLIFLLLDIGRLFHLVPSSLLTNSIKGTVCITVLMVLIFGYGNWHYHQKQRQELHLTTNKHLQKPLKIVMLSDLHLGYHNQRPELSRWIDLINVEHPDLVLIAGDIIDNSIRPLVEQNMADEFKRLKMPVFACLGNHEYISGHPEALRFYEKAGIKLLRDSVVVWGDLVIIGRDDRSNRHRKSVSQLTEKISKDKYSIMLDHQPYHLEATEEQGVDFQLSGHTHYGQVWPISWITEAVYECAYGLWQRGNTHYYITSGMGLWGGKFRIGTCSEYVVATLKKE